MSERVAETRWLVCADCEWKADNKETLHGEAYLGVLAQLHYDETGHENVILYSQRFWPVSIRRAGPESTAVRTKINEKTFEIEDCQTSNGHPAHIHNGKYCPGRAFDRT